MDPHIEVDAWAMSAYKTLDTVGKGFLYK